LKAGAIEDSKVVFLLPRGCEAHRGGARRAKGPKKAKGIDDAKSIIQISFYKIHYNTIQIIILKINNSLI